MSQTERRVRRVIDFIATRLASMLARPPAWGTNLIIEQQVLQLLDAVVAAVENVQRRSRVVTSEYRMPTPFRDIPEGTCRFCGWDHWHGLVELCPRPGDGGESPVQTYLNPAYFSAEEEALRAGTSEAPR